MDLSRRNSRTPCAGTGFLVVGDAKILCEAAIWTRHNRWHHLGRCSWKLAILLRLYRILARGKSTSDIWLNPQIYDQFWLQILSAVATLIEFEGDYVYAALDYRAAENEKETTDDTPSNYRDEPVAFFFIIYGLCFQTLIKMVNKSDAQTNRVITTVLRALRRFLRPSISGNAMYKNFVFAETTDLLDRLVLMESPEVQSMVVQITINLARNHPGALQSIGNERYFTRGFC